MTLLDANILLYAYNRDAAQHATIKSWLEHLLSQDDWIGLAWITLWAFLRITTNRRLFARPLSVKKALEVLRHWLTMPNVVVVQPGQRHAELLEHMITEGQAVGPLVSDAVLAALAIEQGATLASTDRGFSRFPSVRWMNPLVTKH